VNKAIIINTDSNNSVIKMAPPPMNITFRQTPPSKPESVLIEREEYDRSKHLHSYAYERFPKYVYTTNGKTVSIEGLKKLAIVSRALANTVKVFKKYRIVLSYESNIAESEDKEVKEWVLARGSEWEDIIKAYYYLVQDISRESMKKSPSAQLVENNITIARSPSIGESNDVINNNNNNTTMRKSPSTQIGGSRVKKSASLQIEGNSVSTDKNSPSELVENLNLRRSHSTGESSS